MPFDPIARVRRFNRAVTTAVGALDTSFLGRGRALGSARLLWSIAPEGSDVADLRIGLRLDSGLMSRLLRGLEAEGLVVTSPSGTDRRRRIARLTPAGLAEKTEYDRLNDTLAAGMIGRVPRNRDALLAAMDLIALNIGPDPVTIAPANPDDPDARACLTAYFRLLSDRINGISPAHVPDPDPEAAAYRPPHGAFLLAHADGLPVACVALKTLSSGVGEVKRLWVDPAARGQGLARRMMHAVEEAARALGHRTLKLDTNENLPEAIALYRADGWAETAPYTDWPATHWFEKPL